MLVFSLTWSAKYNVEVQTIDTNGRIILDTQVNVFLDTKSEVACGRKVVTSQLVFPDLETTKQFINVCWKTDHVHIFRIQRYQ